MTNFKKLLKRPIGTKIKFKLLLAIPSVLLFISIIVIMLTSTNSSIKFIKASSLYALEAFSNQNETAIMNIDSYVALLEDNSDTVQFLTNREIVPDLNTENIRYSLSKFEKSMSYVDSIILYNKYTDTCISSNTVCDADIMFGKFFEFKNYPYSYWKDFIFLDSSMKRILPPTTAVLNQKPTNTIPIIFRKIGDCRISNYVIVNLSLDKLIEQNEQFKQTKNTHFYILNKYTGQIFSTGADSGKKILDTDFYEKLLKGGDMFRYKGEDNVDSMVFSYSSTNHVLGYTYYSTVPYKDIMAIQIPTICLYTVFTLILLVFILFITTKNVNTVMNPFNKLAEMLHLTTKNNDDILALLQNSTATLVNKNSMLSTAFPIAVEKYLIDYLNGTDYSIDAEMRNTLKESLPFDKTYFCSVIMCLVVTNEFFNSFNNIEYSNVQAGLFGIIKDLFISQFNAFLISSERDTLYIIINTDTPDEDLEKINKTIDTIVSLLKNDTEYIDLCVGIGDMHEQLSGLKASHSEALKNLRTIPKHAPQIILQSPSKTIKYSFTSVEESKLLNLLLAYKQDEAMELIHAATKKNEHRDARSIKQLYWQILLVVLKAMRIKNIPYGDNDKTEYEILLDMQNQAPNELYKSIVLMLKHFHPDVNPVSRSDDSNIIEFINQNFRNNYLSLDYLANTFNISSSYMSNKLKSILNCTYHEYINELRIAEAKTLLSTTDSTIQEIYTQVGFTNKQTFIRSFKAATGLTPSEYRRSNK